MRERIRAVCEEHEQAEGAGGGAGGGAGEHAPPALAGASTHRARGAGTGGGQAQAEAEALDAVEPPGVPQQEAGSPPSPPGEAPSEPEGGGRGGPGEGSEGVWSALRAIQVRCDAQERATEDLQRELRSFYGTFSEALGARGGASADAHARIRQEECGKSPPASESEP